MATNSSRSLISLDSPIISTPGFNKASTPLSSQSPTRNSATQNEISLELRRVIGTTTCSPGGFASSTSLSCFATCAGSVVVLNYIDESLEIAQKFFRARPNVLSGQSVNLNIDTPGPPVTPDARSKQSGFWKGNFNSPKWSGSPAAEQAASASKLVARQRARAATCLSLSNDGRFIAVGEVWRLLPQSKMTAEQPRQVTVRGC
jgi:hypothetical protein